MYFITRELLIVTWNIKCFYLFFFQIDKQLASGEYFIQEKERKLKAWQEKKVNLVPWWVVRRTKAYHRKRNLFAL